MSFQTYHAFCLQDPTGHRSKVTYCLKHGPGMSPCAMWTSHPPIGEAVLKLIYYHNWFTGLPLRCSMFSGPALLSCESDLVESTAFVEERWQNVQGRAPAAHATPWAMLSGCPGCAKTFCDGYSAVTKMPSARNQRLLGERPGILSVKLWSGFFVDIHYIQVVGRLQQNELGCVWTPLPCSLLFSQL